MDNTVSKCIITLRVLLFCVFFYFTVNISFASVCSCLMFLGSLFLLSIKPKNLKLRISDYSNYNPLKGKPKLQHADLPDDILHKVSQSVSDFVTYEGSNAKSLESFKIIQQNTDCIFAKKAKLWGSTEYDINENLETNLDKSLPTFLKFCGLCEHLGLDGFVFEFPAEFGNNVEVFGDKVSQILFYISKKDPKERDCFNSTNIEKRGWVFEFNTVTFFITTFAPCYSSEHPRYCFNSKHCFVLFQPEISFAQHNLPPDTIHTSWIKPRTVRDQIRIAFKKSGRDYHIRSKLSFPMIYDIVRPVYKYEDYIVWWKNYLK